LLVWLMMAATDPREIELVPEADPERIETWSRALAEEDGSIADYRSFVPVAGGHHYMVWHRGQPKGYVCLVFSPGQLHIQRLLIFREWRRAGLAGMLFERLLREGRVLSLDVLAHNGPALACYQKYGWQIASIVLRKGCQQLELVASDDLTEQRRLLERG
jgi:ribosomal protein S18 acetylase RimI-like enzyme